MHIIIAIGSGKDHIPILPAYGRSGCDPGHTLYRIAYAGVGVAQDTLCTGPQDGLWQEWVWLRTHSVRDPRMAYGRSGCGSGHTVQDPRAGVGVAQDTLCTGHQDSLWQEWVWLRTHSGVIKLNSIMILTNTISFRIFILALTFTSSDIALGCVVWAYGMCGIASDELRGRV